MPTSLNFLTGKILFKSTYLQYIEKLQLMSTSGIP
jgi:hypothetical protein